MYHMGHHKPLAGAITAGILYSLSTAFWYFSPQQALKLHAQLMHLDNLDFLAPLVHVTAANYISGLLQVMAWTFLALWVFCCFKSYFSGSQCNSGACRPGQNR